MSEVDGIFVRRGLWTNHDQGEIMGKTITTDNRTGIIIVAVMAVMSTVATSHLWNLLVFVYHQTRASETPTDALFRQQQAILRSLPPPSSLAADSIKLWWAWRKMHRKAFKRSLVQILMAAMCAVAFLTAGILSSNVISTSNLEVLVSSSHCGFINYSLVPSDLKEHLLVQLTASATPYASECYNDQDIVPARCRGFIHPNIPFTTERTSCPFTPEYCVEQNLNASANLPALVFDSGLISVNSAFGMNLPKNEAVHYRRRTTCTVLPLPGHETVLNATLLPTEFWNGEIDPDSKAVIMSYGTQSELGEWRNITTLYNVKGISLLKTFRVAGQIYYSEPSPDRNNSWIPSPGLRPDRSDVLYLGLLTGFKYANPVDDPWLLAHKPMTILSGNTFKNETFYQSDSLGRAMGCAVQHQYCFETKSGVKCSQIGALPLKHSLESWENASPLQTSVLRLLVESYYWIFASRVNELRLQPAVENGGVISAKVPNDQWIVEARGIEAATWAAMQFNVADYAIGSLVRYPDIAGYFTKPKTNGEEKMCSTQKMRKAGGFVNVNVFGMTFIIVFALSCVILDLIFLKVVVYTTKFRNAFRPNKIELWIQDGVLQLQRRVYEADGQGTWYNYDKEVPLTAPQDVLTAFISQSRPKSPISTTDASTLVSSPARPDFDFKLHTP